MTKVASSLRWVIIAPEAEVIKWTTAFQKEAPEIVLEVGPEVADPASVDILYMPLMVVEADGGGFMSTGVLVGAAALAVLVALLMTLKRRRATAEEMKIIDSWGVFGDGAVEDDASDEESNEGDQLLWKQVGCTRTWRYGLLPPK